MGAITFDKLGSGRSQSARWDWLASRKVQAAILFLFALAARASAFGDPNYHVDEAFYFLVGKAMQDGALPYVDLWDRKPFGLFAFFSLLNLVSTTVWSFQIAALGFVTATAVLVTSLARRWSDPVGALLAGLISIAMLQPLLGGGGQSPVFYNLFVIGAVALLIGEVLREGYAPRLGRAAAAAALAGIAVWFKPTAVFEGAFVVIGFGWLAWQRSRKRFWPLFLTCATLASIPTVATYSAYAAMGHFAEIWQATVVSNFQKLPSPGWVWRSTVIFVSLSIGPLAVSALIGWIAARQSREYRLLATWLGLWGLAAICGFLVIPNFYSHYALPLVPVFAVLAAPAFVGGTLARFAAVFVVAWGLVHGQSLLPSQGTQSRVLFERAVAAIDANRDGGRLYVFDGPVALYNETGAQWSGRYPFPEHLSNGTEAPALGVDASEEIIRVLDAKPEVIALTTSPKPTYNRANYAILRDRIAAQYHPVCAMPLFDYEHKYWLLIYSRSATPDRSQCLGGSTARADTWLVNPKSFGLMESDDTFIEPGSGTEAP